MEPDVRSRSLSSAAAGVLLLVLLAGPLRAQCGDPGVATSTVPAYVTLVGHDGSGTCDPAGTCQVTVRDLAGNVVPGIGVRLDFSSCTDLRLASTQSFPGMTVDCTARSVHAVTDANGIARFCVMGGAVNPGNAPGAASWCMRIYVGEEIPCSFPLIASRTASAVDQNGFDGATANDLAAWLSDFVHASPVGRSDYDASGALGANDLSKWLAFYGAGGSRFGIGSLPGAVCP